MVTRYAYDADGRTLVEVAGPPNLETFAWPDDESPGDLGELPSSDPRRVTRYAYDPDTGDLVATTRPDGTVEARAYDDAGRIHEITETAAPVGEDPPPSRLVARYDYDLRGRVLHEWAQWVDPAGDVDEVVVDRTWTPTGLRATETDPHLDGASPGEISTVTMGYTDAGRLAAVTDALGNVVTYDYELGRRVRRQVWDLAGTTVVSQQTWTYARDGQVATVSVPHDPGDPSPPVTVYDHDDRGRVASVVDATGRSEVTSYTSGGQPATVTWADGPSDLTPTTVEVTYDGAGRRVAATGSVGGYAWSYDRAGRLVSETRPGGAGPATDMWRWDLAGNRVWHRSDGGRRLRYGWDEMARLDGVWVDVAEEVDPPVWFPVAGYGRDGFGQTVRETLQAGGVGQRLWERDLMGRVRGYDQDVASPDLSPVVTATELTWRPDGRLASDATTDQPVWAYDYDAAGQLVEADPDVGATLTWSYGVAGQRTSHTNDDGTFAYVWDQGSSQLEAVTGPDGVRAFTYDAAGRRLTDTITPTSGPSASVDYAYDDRGRLSALTGPSGVTERRYDIDGQLASSIDARFNDPPVQLDLHWDPTMAVPALSRLAMPTGGELFLTVGESLLSFGIDGLGDTAYPPHDVHRSLTVTAAPVSAYDPFGRPDTTVDALAIGYRSELTLDNLVHLRHRDYDPTTGTFTTPDPLDGVDGTPTVGNPYHYTDNDPLNKTDPLGLRPGDTEMRCPPGEAPGQGPGTTNDIYQAGLGGPSPYSNFCDSPGGGLCFAWDSGCTSLIRGWSNGNFCSAWYDDECTAIKTSHPGLYQATLVVAGGAVVVAICAVACPAAAAITLPTGGLAALAGVTAPTGVMVITVSAADLAAAAGTLAGLGIYMASGGRNAGGGSSSGGGPGPLRGAEAREAAKQLGYSDRTPPQRVPGRVTHGQPAFSNGRQYISPDVDGHRGGVWKMFDRSWRRVGTYNADLSVKVGP